MGGTGACDRDGEDVGSEDEGADETVGAYSKNIDEQKMYTATARQQHE